MTTGIQPAGGGPSSSGLADVIDTILDKGLVIDAYVRLSLVGIEIISVDARVVVASVDSYLRFAQAVNRLEISETEPKGLPDMMGEAVQGVAKSRTQGALDAAGQKVSDFLTESQAQPSRQKAKRIRARRADR
jgi:hypothetical protein